MSDINTVCLSGNLGQKPDLKYFESGKVVANISVAVDEYQGSTKPLKTNWFLCKIWGKKAEFVSEYAKIGSLVFVQGRLTSDTYKNEKGENRQKIYILVDEIKIANKNERS